ncbi:MAG: hypothetical protein ACI38Z_05005 [Parafannyhessea sp.]|uniref:hypothetical protein n=1 Tax=Parafannyhessea sp. TaxID=2847324 RepID=UPI003EFC0085
MTPFGIRSEREIGPFDGEFIIDSVKLANEQAPNGYSFYFEEPDMPEQIIDGKHCVDMFGWLVPNDRKSEFEPIWKRRGDNLDDFKSVIVSFDEVNGKPVARFW